MDKNAADPLVLEITELFLDPGCGDPVVPHPEGDTPVLCRRILECRQDARIRVRLFCLCPASRDEAYGKANTYQGHSEKRDIMRFHVTPSLQWNSNFSFFERQIRSLRKNFISPADSCQTLYEGFKKNTNMVNARKMDSTTARMMIYK